MRRWVGPRVQIALVVALFLGSLALLLYNLSATLRLPQQEMQARARLREASRKMAEAAAEVLAQTPTPQSAPEGPLNMKLRHITAQVLQEYAGVEGGFFVADGPGWFGGYAYPTNPHGELASLKRNEPPPIEAPLIRAQVQTSLDKGESILRTEDAGPSRVVLLTEPVGKQWPQRLSTWLLFRLTGPEALAEQVWLYEWSTGLALGGIALALVLTLDLGRVLRRQRREQERLRDELRRAEHLAALGKLLAGVAHEVRNPLAAIRSTVQLWERLPDAARVPASLEAVLAAVDRLGAIVGRLLLFSRADNAQREPVDLNRVLSETLDLLQAQAAGQRVTLERDFAADLPTVLGSANALRQVVLNLLSNALQAMPQGGRLRCRTRTLARQDAVEVEIADTGPGVSAEDRQHLFEPFFTTRPEGTGLGLALCREIVQNHGGHIELVEDQGPGAVFRFVLPIRPQEAGHAHSA